MTSLPTRHGIAGMIAVKLFTCQRVPRLPQHQQM